MGYSDTSADAAAMVDGHTLRDWTHFPFPGNAMS
jgi:hypothetical protein